MRAELSSAGLVRELQASQRARTRGEARPAQGATINGVKSRVLCVGLRARGGEGGRVGGGHVCWNEEVSLWYCMGADGSVSATSEVS